MPSPQREITTLTPTTFYEFVREHKFVVIHFWASWNGYDVQMRGIIETQVPDRLHERIRFGRFDIESPEHEVVCHEHQVLNVPALAFYRNAKLLRTLIGLHKVEVIIQNLDALVEATD